MLLEKRVSGACGKRMQKYIGLSRHLAMSPLYSPCVRVSCSCSLPPALLIQAQRPLSQVWQAREWNCEVIQLSENADKNMFGRRKIGCGQQSQYVESAIWYAWFVELSPWKSRQLASASWSPYCFGIGMGWNRQSHETSRLTTPAPLPHPPSFFTSSFAVARSRLETSSPYRRRQHHQEHQHQQHQHRQT